MDWNLILNYALKALGSAAATFVITYATILFTKLKEKIKESRIAAYVDKVVRAAEQIYPNEGQKTGKEKLEYVTNMVLEKFPKLTNNDYLKSLIEGAVYSVSQELKLKNSVTEKVEEEKKQTLSSF